MVVFLLLLLFRKIPLNNLNRLAAHPFYNQSQYFCIQARRAAAAEARRHEEMAEDTSESSTNDDEISNPYEDLFTTVMLATDLDNRPLHTVFQLLPSKKVRRFSITEHFDY